MEPVQILTELAKGAIGRLGQMPQPVVRVSGPITSGGFGYEENLRRFIKAQQILRENGFTVFDYFEDNDDEAIIKDLTLVGNEVMDYYHQPILETGLITAVYMMPRWEESGGARAEHEHFVSNKLKVELIPDEWFD